MVVFRRHFILMFFQALFLLACSGFDEIKVSFGPSFWREHDPNSDLFVDHRAWGYLLEKHVRTNSDGTTYVSYANFTSEDRQELKNYIQNLATFPIEKLNRKEQYAFWLNLYNALVVRLVLEHYLILSISDIKIRESFLSAGPFDQTLVVINGLSLSLSAIRNKILSDLFLDPRFHYGLCTAALGSPRLQPRPYTGDRVDRMLDEAALEYVNHPRAVTFKNKTIVLSGLYQTYPKEFGRTSSEILQHIRHYAMDHLKEKLLPDAEVTFHFDWSLNDGMKLR